MAGALFSESSRLIIDSVVAAPFILFDPADIFFDLLSFGFFLDVRSAITGGKEFRFAGVSAIGGGSMLLVGSNCSGNVDPGSSLLFGSGDDTGVRSGSSVVG